MKRKTFLFFPVEVGLAHIARCLAVAEACIELGHEAVVALPSRKQSLFASSPVPFVEIEGYSSEESVEGIMQALKFRQFRTHLQNEITLIERLKPHAVIIDFRYTAMISGFITRTPVISINNSTSLPTWYKIPAYAPFKFLKPILGPIVNIMVQSIKNSIFANILADAKSMGYSVEYSDILTKPHYIIPEHMDYFGAVNNSIQTSYVPPIEWAGFSSQKMTSSFHAKSSRPTIYVSFGGTGFDGIKMVSISNALIAAGYQVIISTGSLISPHAFTKNPNLHVFEFVDPKRVMKHVDVLICHGGYGTITEAIRQHIPFISIPFNPEQLMHALRTEELGMSINLARFSISDLIALARQDWASFESIGRRISDAKVVSAVDTILSHRTNFQANMRTYSYMLSEENGALAAAQLIINSIKN